MHRSCLEKYPELIHQLRGRLCEPLRIGVLRHILRMWGERIQKQPCPHIAGVAGEGGINPTQRLGQPSEPSLRVEAAPGHVLHQPMHREPLALDLLHRQRDCGEIGECLV